MHVNLKGYLIVVETWRRLPQAQPQRPLLYPMVETLQEAFPEGLQ